LDIEKKIVLIDNYDSFSYNLVHQIEQIVSHKIDVYKNDKISLSEIAKYDYIVLSPGPGLPEGSGIILDLIKEYYTTKKILGICLGLQAIVIALGGKLKNLEQVYHGIEAEINHDVDYCKILNNISNPFRAGRYHSWIADTDTLPTSLQIICTDTDGEIMGVQHQELPLIGLQFHPESIMTPEGNKMIANFLDL